MIFPQMLYGQDRRYKPLLRCLIGAIAALIVPTFGCFAYYRLQAMDNASGVHAMLVTLALPISTLGLIAAALIWPRRQRHRLLWRLCLLLLFGSIAFLINTIY